MFPKSPPSRNKAESGSGREQTTASPQQTPVGNDGKKDKASTLKATFGLLVLLLASVGLYGVRAYPVARRVPEIGLRMALGSNRTAVIGLILRGAMVQALLGLANGVPAALLAGHYLQSQLFGIKGCDPRTLLSAGAVLAICALAASAVPARRASAVEPMQALRSE